MLAGDKIFFNVTTARRLASDLKYYQDKTNIDSKLISELNNKNALCLDINKATIEKSLLLEEDKKLLKTRGDKLEELSNTCTKNLAECTTNTPSRLTWFGIGAVSTLVVGLLLVFTIKN